MPVASFTIIYSSVLDRYLWLGCVSGMSADKKIINLLANFFIGLAVATLQT